MEGDNEGFRCHKQLKREEDRKWFMEAIQSQTIDVIKRMKDITLVMQTPDQVLEAQGVTSADIEDMLDELEEHVESSTWLMSSHCGIRAKAAEVVTTIVQNYPKSQQLVMEANGLEYLHFRSRSLVRHNKPRIAAFRLANGYAGLRDALGSENVGFQRKALNLVQYLLYEKHSDCNTVISLDSLAS